MNKLNELEDKQIDKTNQELNSVNLIKSLDEQKSFDEKKKSFDEQKSDD